MFGCLGQSQAHDAEVIARAVTVPALEPRRPLRTVPEYSPRS